MALLYLVAITHKFNQAAIQWLAFGDSCDRIQPLKDHFKTLGKFQQHQILSSAMTIYHQQQGVTKNYMRKKAFLKKEEKIAIDQSIPSHCKHNMSHHKWCNFFASKEADTIHAVLHSQSQLFD